MTHPKVSIIVPIYNVEKYLDRCMNSLLNQTLKDIEIIMVDDGSPDNCPKMCDEYAKKDVRVKVIHKQNAGLGYARNSGLDVAIGEYIAFVDSDDYVELNMYETLYETATEKDCDAVYSGFRIEMFPNRWQNSNEVDNDKYWEGDDVRMFMLNMIASEAHQPQERLFQMSVWHSVYRRSIIEQNCLKFVSERDVASEDIPFQVDFLLRAKRVAYIDKDFYSYCLNDTSLTATLKPEKYERYKTLRNCLLAKVDESEYKNRVNRLFIGYVRSHLYDIVNSNWKDKRKMLRKILDDTIWKTLRQEYPPQNLPTVSRLVYEFVLWGNPLLLLLTMYFLNVLRRNSGGARSFTPMFIRRFKTF